MLLLRHWVIARWYARAIVLLAARDRICCPAAIESLGTNRLLGCCNMSAGFAVGSKMRGASVLCWLPLLCCVRLKNRVVLQCFVYWNFFCTLLMCVAWKPCRASVLRSGSALAAAVDCVFCSKVLSWKAYVVCCLDTVGVGGSFHELHYTIHQTVLSCYKVAAIHRHHTSPLIKAHARINLYFLILRWALPVSPYDFYWLVPVSHLTCRVCDAKP